MEFTELLERYLNETRPDKETLDCLLMLSRVVTKSSGHPFQEFTLWAYDEGRRRLLEEILLRQMLDSSPRGVSG